MGNYVQIDHGTYNGRAIIARYMHMKDSPLVSTGSNVNQSQQIGWMGNTGASSGMHLHIDFNDPNYVDPTYKWNYYNPETFLAAPHANEVTDYWEKNPSLKQ